ncbi:hypothetical protein D3C86_1816290 [compost metagenome]
MLRALPSLQASLARNFSMAAPESQIWAPFSSQIENERPPKAYRLSYMRRSPVALRTPSLPYITGVPSAFCW